MAHKRSFTEAFLVEESSSDNASKKATRVEFARAKNRTDLAYQNLLKTKERVKALLEKMREYEAAHQAAKEEMVRLQTRLKDDIIN